MTLADPLIGTDISAGERGRLRSAETKLNLAWQVLRVGLGAGAFLAGLDKFFNLLTTWSMYLSPLAERLLPIGAGAFMRIIGIGEMLLGLAILTRFTQVGAYAMAAWLAAIAVNLAASGNFWDLAVRDLEIALSAFTLGCLTEWRIARLKLGAKQSLGRAAVG